MNIMIVEDDLFKFSNIESLVREQLHDVDITRFDNVHDTVIFLKNKMPNKIILDMSLPSHAAKIGEGSPLSMPTGGIEIILELRSLNKCEIPIIVLTQYPDIEIEGEYYSIDDAGSKIKTLYGMKHLIVAHYENEEHEIGHINDWKILTTEFLRT